MKKGIKAALLIFLPFLLLCWTTPGYGQKIKKKAKAFYTEGLEHINWERFKEAEQSFQDALKIEAGYSKALQSLGFVYVKTRQYEKGFTTLTELVGTGDFSTEIYFELAKLCLATNRPDEADALINKYVENTKPGTRQEELKQLKENLAFIKKHAGDQKGRKFELVPAGSGVNTSAREYFPTMTADGNRLYFSRMVQAGKLDNEDIFYSEWSGKEWKEAISLGPNINTSANEAAPAISPDGRTLYFTICESEDTYGGCDIWFSKKVGDEWMKPQNIGKPINTQAKETQPCISSDGRSLYFVSSRKGGQGRLDMWVSHMDENGNWGEPINLGPDVNTIHDEQRPFIHPDNQTLYFSSDGHPGFGNDDVFLSRLNEKGNWATPVNMGAQVNSYENEEGLYVSLHDLKGFLATDRAPTGDPYARDYDIYYFVLPPVMAPKQVTYVKGKVMEADTKKFIAADINFLDLTTGELVNQSKSDEKNGEFLLCLPVGKSYAMNIAKETYLFHSQFFSLKNIPPGKTYYLEAELNKIKIDETVALRNIFYEIGSAKLDKTSMVELKILVKFLTKNPSTNIEIGGHTDNTGSKQINLDLSKARAKSVYDFLIEQGIPKSRLSYKGYGQSQPIADNSTEDGRAYNRRTEFRVVE